MQTNLLALTGFKLTIGGGGQYKKSEYFAVAATFPNVSLGEANTSYLNRQGFVPDDVLIYEPFTIRLAVDENLEVYNEMHSWMLHNTRDDRLRTEEMILHFMTAHHNVSQRVRFTHAFPTSIGSIEFNTQSTSVEYAYVDVSFRYDMFEFMR